MNEEDNVPGSIEGVAATVQETVFGIWADFVDHIPYLVAGVVVLMATWLLGLAVGRVLQRIMHSWRMRESLKALLLRIASIAVWTFGILLAAMVVFPGLTPTKALGGLGLASIAIGFAFKDIFENFFAGILMLWRFPFENGDFIECEGLTGKVEEVNIRMTQIRKTTGELVVVPNSFLFKNPVQVLTDRPTRRIGVVTGIAYDESVDDAVGVIESAVSACKTVNMEQPIQVFPQAFGASSIDIEVTWWTEATPLGLRRSRGEVVTAIKRALDDAGIEIPFPYRTLTFKEPLQVTTTQAEAPAGA